MVSSCKRLACLFTKKSANINFHFPYTYYDYYNNIWSTNNIIADLNIIYILLLDKIRPVPLDERSVLSDNQAANAEAKRYNGIHS